VCKLKRNYKLFIFEYVIGSANASVPTQGESDDFGLPTSGQRVAFPQIVASLRRSFQVSASTIRLSAKRAALG
jgi:hypothetical protein